jgi:hypothetical protein
MSTMTSCRGDGQALLDDIASSAEYPGRKVIQDFGAPRPKMQRPELRTAR